MKIGIVTTWFERGAAYVSRQYRDVLAKEHEVFIYARGGESYAQGDPNWDTPDVTWGRQLPSKVPTEMCLKDFEHWIRAHQIELLIFNEQWWWPAVAHANALGVITCAYIDYYTETTVPFFGIYDRLICNTKRHLSAFDWHPGAVFVPWGTDVSVFKPQARPASASADKQEVVFFHSAGISPGRKGTDLLLSAFAHVRGPAKLLIHIQRDLKKALPEQAALIDQLRTEGRLETEERTVTAPGLFHLGDVYVYPTRLEGIGLTIMEAAACSLPVIVTDAPPMNEFILHEHNGRLVNVARHIARADGYLWPQAIVDVASLTEALQWYVDHPQQLSTCKAQARAHAEQHFDWQRAGESLLQALAMARKRPVTDADALRGRIADYTEQQRLQNHISGNLWLRMWLSYRTPGLLALLKGLRDFLTGKPLKKAAAP